MKTFKTVDALAQALLLPIAIPALISSSESFTPYPG